LLSFVGFLNTNKLLDALLYGADFYIGEGDHAMPTDKIRSMLAALLIVVWAGSGAHAEGFFRTQNLMVPTVTLTVQQFLTGDKNGKPTVVAGELYLPGPATSNEKLPAVILVPGLGGATSSHERWARELNNIGVAAFVLDSFAPRGLYTMSVQPQLPALAIMVDAYRALDLLAQHPSIDPTRIAIMGFSYGTIAAVYSSNERFRKVYGPSTAQFAAHIGLYSLCHVTFREDTITTGKPIRLFHGVADEATSIVPCRSYVERLKKAGADVTLTEFPDAHHGYDWIEFPNPVLLAQAPTVRNCIVEEGTNGQLTNSKTGKPFDLTDPCLEKGWHFVYNAAASEATLQSVKQLLKEKFALK
jgi:dienelactone hydrolase